MVVSQPQWELIPQVHAVIVNDSKLFAILQLCIQGTPPHPHYSVQDQSLYLKKRLVLPPNSPLIEQVLHKFHTSPIWGHTGIARTMARVSSQFYWQGMQQDIKIYVQNYLLCQQAKTTNSLPARLLQPLPIPQQIWDDLAMDFIVGLPPSNGYTVIMVVVDHLSKYGHFSPLKAYYSSKTVAEKFMHSMLDYMVYQNRLFQIGIRCSLAIVGNNYSS